MSDPAAIGTLAYEFPTFPADSLPAIPDWLTPSHWHNDMCPSWRAEFTEGSVTLFVDFPDPAQREFADSLRFNVTVSTGDHSGEPYVYSDDWTEILTALESARTLLTDPLAAFRAAKKRIAAALADLAEANDNDWGMAQDGRTAEDVRTMTAIAVDLEAILHRS